MKRNRSMEKTGKSLIDPLKKYECRRAAITNTTIANDNDEDDQPH